MPDVGYEEARAISEAAFAQTAIRDYPERTMETQELAHAFCTQTQLRAERLFHEVCSNADEANHRLASTDVGKPLAAAAATGSGA